VGPEVSQFLKLVGHNEAILTLQSLDFDSKSLIFFAVNNQQDPASAGGSHWSLLVYDQPEHSFHHFDSGGRMNEADARALAQVIDGGGDKNARISFNNVPCRQQDNGYNCGVFLLAHTEHVARQFLARNSENPFVTKDVPEIDLRTVTNFRQRLHQLIRELSSR
jgi:sentrin-specific protease 8